MLDLADHQLTSVAGGFDMMNAIDSTASTIGRATSHVGLGFDWNKMSCTSRAMWVGTAAGASAGAAGSAINPAVGTFVGPVAGTAAATSYLEACNSREAAKK